MLIIVLMLSVVALASAGIAVVSVIRNPVNYDVDASRSLPLARDESPVLATGSGRVDRVR